MDKFVIFSLGQKYQYVNSEVLRKYITKGRSNNFKDFIEAYKTLKTNKGNCFVATYLYGSDHPITENLRNFKRQLNKSVPGKKIISTYYAFSPPLLRLVFRHPQTGPLLTNIIIRPLVLLTYYLWDLKLFKK
jgi:hypothetical protein